jgi:hypothetical protein
VFAFGGLASGVHVLLVFDAPQFTITIGRIPDVAVPVGMSHHVLIPDGVPFDTLHHVAPDVSSVVMILGNSSVFGGGSKIYRGVIIGFPGISVDVWDIIKIMTINHVGSHPVGSVALCGRNVEEPSTPWRVSKPSLLGPAIRRVAN